MLNNMELDKITETQNMINVYMNEYNLCEHLLDLDHCGIPHINVKVQNFCTNDLSIDPDTSSDLINRINSVVKKVIEEVMEEDSEKLRKFL